MPRGIMLAAASPAEGRDDDFNRWYDEEHLPVVLAVPGFVGARRYRRLGDGGAHRYLTVYEIDADDITAPVVELRRADTPDRRRGAEVLAGDPAPLVCFFEELDL